MRTSDPRWLVWEVWKGVRMNARAETYKHIQTVQRFLGRCIRNLMLRGEVHDASKLESPEAEIFELATYRLAGMTYGSDEYKAALADMKPALDHHYANNRHHPEYFRFRCSVCSGRFSETQAPIADWGDQQHRFCPQCMPHPDSSVIWEAELVDDPQNGIKGMTLLDLVEMLCDWKAATLRHNDGDILRSIEVNQKRFGYGDELKQILRNTVDELERE